MRRALLLIGLLGLLVPAALPVHAASPGRAPDAVGTALQVEPAASPAAAPRQPFAPPRHAFDWSGTRAGARTAPVRSGPTTSAPSVVTQNAAGISAAVDAATTLFFHTPSDSTGAVGPNHYIEMVNATVEMFDKSLVPVVGGLVSLNSLTGTSTPTEFDPQIQWDPQSLRWYYALDSVYNGSTNNRLAFGWTKRQGDPTNLTLTAADWCRFEYATGSEFHDYPKLGHDAANMIIGTNIFNGTAGSFLSASIVVVPKPPAGTIATCGSPSVAQFGTGASPLFYPSAPYTSQKVLTPVPTNASDGGSGEVVSVCCAAGTGKLFGWHIGAGPTLVADIAPTVSTFNQPGDIPQPGTSFTLDSSDTRLTQAVAHYDPDAGAQAVWTQHTVDNGGPSAVRWYEYIPSTGILRQSGTVTSGSRYVFNGAISPAGVGNTAAVGYNTGSSTEFAAARAQSRFSSDALGQMSGEVTLATSTVADTDFSCGRSGVVNQCRWGDYAAASPDPSDSNAVWLTTMLTGTGGFPGNTGSAGWATQNSALRLRLGSTNGTPPAPATPGGRISPGSSSPAPSSLPRLPQAAAPLPAPSSARRLPQAEPSVGASRSITAPAARTGPGPSPERPAAAATAAPDVVPNPPFGFTA